MQNTLKPALTTRTMRAEVRKIVPTIAPNAQVEFVGRVSRYATRNGCEQMRLRMTVNGRAMSARYDIVPGFPSRLHFTEDF